MKEIDLVVQSFVSQSRLILGENLVGVYLHGSAVMGCFNPAKGIEMSIVLRDVCKPFVYPTPFELHFSERHIKWYSENPTDYVQKMKGTDKDLAAHFTVICACGKCLWGAPVSDVFAEVPVADYMDSLWEDICDAPDEIENNTMYLTLNLARVLAYKKEGRVLSKKEGGEWALKNLPEEYAPVVRAALEEYAGAEQKAPQYDMIRAHRYVDFILEKIRGKEVSHV